MFIVNVQTDFRIAMVYLFEIVMGSTQDVVNHIVSKCYLFSRFTCVCVLVCVLFF